MKWPGRIEERVFPFIPCLICMCFFQTPANGQVPIIINGDLMTGKIVKKLVNNKEPDHLTAYAGPIKSWKHKIDNSIVSNRKKSDILYTIIQNGDACDRSLRLYLDDPRINKAILYSKSRRGVELIGISGTTSPMKERTSADRPFMFLHFLKPDLK